MPPTAVAQLVPTHANQNQLMVDHTNQTPAITYRRRGTVGPQGGLSSSARLTRLRTTALEHSYLLITLHEYDTVKFYGRPQRMAPPATRNTLHRTATRIIYSGDTRNCDCSATAASQGAPVYTGTDYAVSRYVLPVPTREAILLERCRSSHRFTWGRPQHN